MSTPGYSRLTQDEDDRDTITIAASVKSSKSHKSIVKPATYYGEGSFDPPSSESSEEEEALLDEEKPPSSPSFAEQGFKRKTRPSSLRYLLTTLGILIALSCLIGIIAAHTYVGTAYRSPGTRKITMDHIFNGTFYPERRSIEWVPEAEDGVFAVWEAGKIMLVDLKKGGEKGGKSVLVDMMDVRDSRGNLVTFSQWKLSPSRQYLLIKTQHTKQWRHSSFGNYYIHDIVKKLTYPLIPPTTPPTTAYATWSPVTDTIAFVSSNDLYIIPTPSPQLEPIRITNTGNTSVFNGVPDWVYEEEVFSADYALWFSPHPEKIRLTYLVSDETDVDVYEFPIYNPTNNAYSVVPYTSNVKMKYPKPGYSNPKVEVKLVEVDAAGSITSATLSWSPRHETSDSIIQEVTWINEDELIIKEVNRNADDGNVVFFDFSKSQEGKVVRKLGKNGEEGDDGWIDPSQNIYPLASDLLPSSLSAQSGYLDIVPTKEGYNHIALFAPASSGEPRWLTAGEWEVTGGVKGVDEKTQTVYFEGTKQSSIERHLYAVNISAISSLSQEKGIQWLTATELAKEDEPGFFSTDFSPEAGFYVLSYQGPGVPWQKIVQTTNPKFDYPLTTNDYVRNATSQFELPVVTYFTVPLADGGEMNVKELRPPRMDDSGKTKYAVLFRIYNGPASQMVQQTFSVDWHDYLATALGYVVVTIDGRGTGFKGRKWRNIVKDNLGFWEGRDIVEGGRIWASKDYVDPKRIGIWGWSYGGFMSSKVVEMNEGIHSLAMSIAPVTSWRLYDSIYTERYMNLPSLNPSGYINASISNVTGWNNVNYLLAHGSGDDNVHYANSAHLIDMLTTEGIRGWRFRMFTDSDHGISKRGANREVYEFMTEFLEEKWGKGGRRRGW